MEGPTKKSSSEVPETTIGARWPIPGPERTAPTSIMAPFNFHQWIADNKDKLQPPIGAHLVYEESEDFIVFVVGGPNRRTDYHVNQTEEFFFQLKGDMVLKVVVDGEFRDVPITEGSIFLLPAHIPHSPQRAADTVGLVVERRRSEEIVDRLRWYCEQCREVLYEERLRMKTLDIGGALATVVKKFYASEELRTCAKCKHVSSIPT